MSKAEELSQQIVEYLFDDYPDNDEVRGDAMNRVAALLEPHLVGEWKPIESAPKGSKSPDARRHKFKPAATLMCVEPDGRGDICGQTQSAEVHAAAPPKGEQSA